MLEDLYRAFFVRLVRRACWRYGLSKEDAREVVHDAFLLALAKLDTTGNPRSWIYSVVDRLAANWRRKAVRRSRLMEKWNAGGRCARELNRSGEETDPWSDADPEGGEL